jgi:hypothetical protein
MSTTRRPRLFSKKHTRHSFKREIKAKPQTGMGTANRIAVIALLVNVVMVIVSIGLWVGTLGAIRETQIQFEVQNMPYLQIDSVFITADDKMGGISIEAEIRNTGEYTAKLIESSLSPRIDDYRRPRGGVGGTPGGEKRMQYDGGQSDYLSKEKSRRVYLITFLDLEEDYENLLSATSYLLCSGFIKYSNLATGKERIYTFDLEVWYEDSHWKGKNRLNENAYY